MDSSFEVPATIHIIKTSPVPPATPYTCNTIQKTSYASGIAPEPYKKHHQYSLYKKHHQYTNKQAHTNRFMLQYTCKIDK
jgi:hypothetical protein